MAVYLSLILVLVVFSVNCVIAQAPGDADTFCLSEMIDGELNPFFNVHDYGPNRRALMDSKDYSGLLQGADPEDLPWQSVDVDDNNDPVYITEVSHFDVHLS